MGPLFKGNISGPLIFAGPAGHWYRALVFGSADRYLSGRLVADIPLNVSVDKILAGCVPVRECLAEFVPIGRQIDPVHGAEEVRAFDTRQVGTVVIHLPDDEVPDGAVRAAAHEDINLLTLLIGSSEAGLEILARDGSWVPVTSIPGTIVVNVGDMMKRLSNHVLPSTPHRVVNPPGEAAARARYSIPFFMHPNPDYVIETLPRCITPDNPNRYPEPLSAHEFLIERLRENGVDARLDVVGCVPPVAPAAWRISG